MQQDTTNFGDRLQTSFAQVFGQTLPALVGALVILFAGYLLAKVLEKLTERGLRRIRLNHLLERGGVIQAVERSGTHVNPTRVLANLVFWLVMFTVPPISCPTAPPALLLPKLIVHCVYTNTFRLLKFVLFDADMS